MKWIDDSGIERDLEGTKKAETHSSPPSKFLQNQPIPNEGVICYIAAFSDRKLR